MTLKEKLKTNVSINTDGEAGRFANTCEQIADEFAIEFTYWLCDEEITKEEIKERLETYKKEKQL